MNDSDNLAARLRVKYPEGLTAILAIGGTRTSYLLSRDFETLEDPGKIDDPAHYMAMIQTSYQEVTGHFFDLGVQNLIIPTLSHRNFGDRGQEYAERYIGYILWLIQEPFVEFYHAQGIDPYFCGIDTLLHLPETYGAHAIGQAFADFQDNWHYQEGRRKLIWAIVPLPAYSSWQAQMALSDADRVALHDSLMAETSLDQIYTELFHFYARPLLGTDLPIPHFYVGTNRNGDMKLREPLSLSLLCGGPFRLFYTPYPSLFITRATAQRILEDLLGGSGLNAFQRDYQGQYSREVLAAERDRMRALSADPESTVGLTRRIAPKTWEVPPDEDE